MHHILNIDETVEFHHDISNFQFLCMAYINYINVKKIYILAICICASY